MPSSRKSILSISIYNPLWGNYPHWALKITSCDRETHYLQIFGEPGTFHFDETIGKDPVIASHRKDIEVWELENLADVERVRNVARSMRIDTATFYWSCQDWCIDVIDELVEDFVVGVQEDGDEEDLREWSKLRRKLVREMGAD